MESYTSHSNFSLNLLRYAYLNLITGIIRSTLTGNEESQPYCLASVDGVIRMIRRDLLKEVIKFGPRKNTDELMLRSGLDVFLSESAYMMVFEDLLEVLKKTDDHKK